MQFAFHGVRPGQPVVLFIGLPPGTYQFAFRKTQDDSEFLHAPSWQTITTTQDLSAVNPAMSKAVNGTAYTDPYIGVSDVMAQFPSTYSFCNVTLPTSPAAKTTYTMNNFLVKCMNTPSVALDQVSRPAQLPSDAGAPPAPPATTGNPIGDSIAKVKYGVLMAAYQSRVAANQQAYAQWQGHCAYLFDASGYLIASSDTDQFYGDVQNNADQYNTTIDKSIALGAVPSANTNGTGLVQSGASAAPPPQHAGGSAADIPPPPAAPSGMRPPPAQPPAGIVGAPNPQAASGASPPPADPSAGKPVINTPPAAGPGSKPGDGNAPQSTGSPDDTGGGAKKTGSFASLSTGAKVAVGIAGAIGVGAIVYGVYKMTSKSAAPAAAPFVPMVYAAPQQSFGATPLMMPMVPPM